jgi:putative endonuclease
MAYVYILKSRPSNRFYIGSTTDLDQRIAHHLGGHTPSTKRLGKVELVLSQEYKTLKEARLIESRLKKLKRRDYIEKIVEDGFIKINLINKNSHHAPE